MINRRYDCVLYDFDGTLGDSIPLIIKCQQQAYEEVMGNCPRSYDDLLSYIGLPLTETFSIHDKKTSEALLESYLRINCYWLEHDGVPLFPGVSEELQRLKAAGIRQGIVTSKRKTSLDMSLKCLGLEDFFDVIVAKEDTKIHKPEAEPLLLASRILGIDTSRMIYVGDAVGDIKCAQNAGVAPVFVNWSIMPREEITALKPQYIINEMKELSCIIFDGEL